MPLPRASAKPSDAAETATLLRGKSVLLPSDFAKLDREAKKRAFTVTDEVSLDAIRDMRDALAKAKADGIEYREFVKTAGAKLHAQWGIDSPQLKTIFVNNVQQAANHAIVARLNRQRGKFPYWTLDVVSDEVTSATCGYFITYPIVLPAGHPWWAKNAPMRHHRCRTTLRGLTAAEARKIGITKALPDWPPQEGWGGSAPLGEYKANMKDSKVKADNGQGDVHADRPIGGKPLKRKANKLANKYPAKLRAKFAKGAAPRRGLSFKFARGGTSIEVRHMSDRTIQCPSVDIDTTLLDDGPVDATPKLVWNQLTKLGAFRGHPAGPFEITQQINAEIERNFRATKNQKIPIDFEHASEQDPTAGTIPSKGAPAQGWIHDLQNRGPAGLWGLVEWLEPARTYVKQGKYKFFSPAIRFGAKDRVTGQPIGARMTSGALTNNPFLDGMMPLAASDRGAARTVDNMETIQMKLGEYEFDAADVMPKLRLGLFGTGTHQADMANPAECYDALCRLEAAYIDCVAEAPGAEPALVQGALKRLRESMNLGMGITVPEMIALVKQIVEHMIGEHIEELHPDETPASSRDMRDTMDENVVKLRDAETKVVALTNKVTEYETKVAGLELQLKDRNSKIDAITAELVTLRDDEKKRAEADEKAAVDNAFDTYKDAKKLTDADKRQMLLTYRNDRALFNELYPAVRADQRHLQLTISTRRNPAAVVVGAPPPPVVTTQPRSVTMSDTNTRVKELRKEGMSLEDAIVKASAEASQPGVHT
jgi:hypothetical protein